MSGNAEQPKMPLPVAEQFAALWVERLRPYCQRIEVAGSIRRRKAEAGDVEIVLLPDARKGWDLAALIANLPRTKGAYPGKYAQVRLQVLEDAAAGPVGMVWPNSASKAAYAVLPPLLGIKQVSIDLFFCTPETWGLNLFIRTGSADFTAAMATHSQKQGYIWREARVYRRGPGWEHGDRDVPTGAPFDLPTEESVFEFFGVQWVPPEQRTDAQALWRAARGKAT